MAGQLIQVAKATASGNPSVLEVTGINTDDVYMVTFSNIVPSAGERLEIRLTKSGTADTTLNYDNARKGLLTNSAFQNNSDTNDDEWLMATVSNVSYAGTQGIMYCYNFNSSSEYSFVTFELPTWVTTPQLFGDIGGGVHTVASASDGISLKWSSTATFSSGEIVLYKVV